MSEPTLENESVEDAWEFWHQRATKLEALLYEAVRMHENRMRERRKQSVPGAKIDLTEEDGWADNARQALRVKG